MKKQNAIITMALLGFALAACNKKPDAAAADNGGTPPAPGASQAALTQQVPAPGQAEPLMRATYGFAAQLPASTASYTGLYQLHKMWTDFKQSKTWASILANPLLSKELGDPSFQQATEDPDFVKWKAILSDAFGSEAFIAFSEGSEAKMRAWMKINQDMRFANFKSALAASKGGGEQSRNLLASVMPDVKALDVPPMIIGFKVTSQKAALDSELALGEKNLPPFVETGTFNLNGNVPFKSLVITVAKALPPADQDSLKQLITMNMDDAAKADETFQALLSRRVEIAYGYLGDYFIISIGPDHSHLKFAANYGESLLARPEVQQAANYTGKPVVSLSWCSAEMAAALQQEFRLEEIYQSMKQELGQIFTPADTQRLETDLTRLDTEAKGFFNPEITSMTGVIYRDHGLRGEVYGGVKRSGEAPAMKFSGVPTESTFLWVDQMANQAVNEALRVWIEDFAATAYDTFKRVGLPTLPPAQQQSAAMMQQIIVPKVTGFYQTTRDQFAKSLGSESVFAMDLSGEVPDMPEVLPPSIHAGGKMMRLAYLSDVKDRALLDKSWDSYFNLAGEILPMTPLAQQFPEGLPKPANEVVDGVSLSYYALPPPMPKGDLLPNVAVTDTTFVVGTSRSYSLELSQAAQKTTTPSRPLTLDFRVNFKPAFDFADKWLALAAQNPEVFFKDDEDRAEDFKKSEPDIAALLRTLRVFDGMSVQTYEENGVPRISSEIRWNEK